MGLTAEIIPNEFVQDQIPALERLPAAEIYGRSLSAIHKLGKFMVGKLVQEIIISPEARQARAEFYTSVEEGFGTDKELGGGLEVRNFDIHPIINGLVMSKDLQKPISEITGAGLKCAEEKARIESSNNDFRFLPQLTRSKWDHENAIAVDQMVQGKTGYNTRIVISPFPEEAARASGDKYWQGIGYVPSLRRGFVQVYHASENGLVAGSLSFDGSNKVRLREIFSKYDVNIPESEITDNWLKYAITADLSEDKAKALAKEIANQAADPRYKKTTNTVEITTKHRQIMDMVFNESYIHVCESLYAHEQTPGVRGLIFQLADKAEHFNAKYKKALYRMRSNKNQFTDDDAIILHELLVYSTIEMMRALLVKSKEKIQVNNYQIGYLDILNNLETMSAEHFQHMLGGFGAIGARHNRTYSACGLAISPGENENMYKSGEIQEAFGGLRVGEDRYGPLTFQCTEGHWNIRPFNKLIDKCQHKNCKGKVKC